MKITSGGIQKDVEILKHFKIQNDEYILYKNTNGISVGLIQTNNIIAPPADKLDVLLRILGNLLSSNPVEAINLVNGCVVLSNIIEDSLVEVSYQNVNLSEEQIKNAINSQSQVVNEKTVNLNLENNVPESTKEKNVPTNNRMKIYGIIIVVLTIILGVLLFKDKLFSKNSGGSSIEPTPVMVTPTPTLTPQNTNTIDDCINCVFGYYEDNKYYFGTNRVAYSNYVNNYQDLVADNGNQREIFLGHTLSNDGLIEKGFACGIENGNVFCLQGSQDGTNFDNNKEILNRVFGSTNCVEKDSSYICSGSIKADAYADGSVKVIQNNNECQVYNIGDMVCSNR